MSFFKKFFVVCISFFAYVFITFLLIYSDTDQDYTKKLAIDNRNTSENSPTSNDNKLGSTIHCNSTINCFLFSDEIGLDCSWSRNSSLVSCLNLSGNDLQNIPANVFRNQIKLECLFLMNNKLSTIEKNAFYGLFNMKRLYLDFNKLESLIEDFQILTSVEIISLSHNELKLDNETFPRMFSLRELYLDHNVIKVIARDVFQNLTNLRVIGLSNNCIAEIDSTAFAVSNVLSELNLFNNSITQLISSTFSNLKNLRKLYLGHNPLNTFSHDTFKNLTKLQHLNLEEIDMDNLDISMFDSLKELKSVEFRSTRCHYIPKTISCSPSSDGISSFKNLLNRRIFRCWNWIISSTICIGNFLVIFSRMFYRDENMMLSLIIRNLAASDFLMGIYLLVIGVYDLKFRDVYNENAQQWLSSWTCTLTGIMAMVSSEVTVFILLFLSIDRYLVIGSSYGRYKSLNVKYTSIVLTVIWCLGIAVSVIPVIRYANDTKFYGINGLCFPLHIAYPFYTGWQYTAFIIFGINATSLIIIAVVYLGMFVSIRRTRKATPLPKNVYEFVLRFFFIVFIYAMCWLPIILFKAAAYAGAESSEELYGWLVVFILPINSASNPILYTFTTRKYRPKLRISCIFEEVMDETIYDDPSLTTVPTDEKLPSIYTPSILCQEPKLQPSESTFHYTPSLLSAKLPYESENQSN